MPRRDDKPRGSSPIEPRPADEDRGRFRPKMGRRARDRLASGTPASSGWCSAATASAAGRAGRSARLRRAWIPGATRGTS